MKNKFKTILVVVLIVSLFQTNFFHTKARDVEGTQVSESETVNTEETENSELGIFEDVYSNGTYDITKSSTNVDLTIKVGNVKATSANEGDVVKIYTDLQDNYYLDELTVTNTSTGATLTLTDQGSYFTFTMPASAVSITAVGKQGTTHSINVVTVTGGTISVNTYSSLKNKRIIVTPSPWEGYNTDYDNLSIVGASGSITPTVLGSGKSRYWQFYMPDEDVTITPSFTLDPDYEYSINTSSATSGFSIVYYKNTGTTASPIWTETTSAKANQQVKFIITLSSGYGIRRVGATYVDQATGVTTKVPGITTKGLTQTFTMPQASITMTVQTSMNVPHCDQYNEEDPTICDVCEVGYTRSDDGKTCSQTKPVSFATDDWGIVNDCALDIDNCPYNVGDERIINLNGSEYTLRIANMSSPADVCGDDTKSQTACGFVVEFYTCTTTMDIIVNESTTKSNTDGSWTETSVYSYLYNTLLPVLEENKIVGTNTTPLKNVMIPTNVVSGSNYGEKANNNRQTWMSRDEMIYLFSLSEIYTGTADSDHPDIDYTIASMDNGVSKTRQLDLYAGLKTTSSAEEKSQLVYKNTATQSSARDWWLRTPSNQKENNSTHYYAASTFGGAGYKRVLSNIHGYARAMLKVEYVEKGVAPAFRIGNPSNKK